MITTMLIVSFFASCYYDNLEELHPKDTTQVITCDTGNVNYSNHISNILSTHCTSCHSGGAPSGGISLTDYTSVKNIAATGKLVGAVTWDGTASPMPKGAANKIPDCSIEQIKKWVRTNYPQ